MPDSHFRAVFISPHLDDAVFSCAGQIARLVAEGPVLVLNIFTQYLSEVKNRGVVLGEERYAEEAAAASFLGFSSRRLDELDVSFRDDAYRSLAKIFRAPIERDVAAFPALQEKVLQSLADVTFDQLYLPLAVGWHVDHVLAHLVFQPWQARSELVYYEDAPYCLLPHATRYRLNELGTYARPPHDVSLAPADDLRAWWDTTTAFMGTALMKNVKPWLVRMLGVPVVSAYLYGLLASHAGPKGPPRGNWQSTIIEIEPFFSRKVDAMMLYRSQFKEFFLGRSDCVCQFEAYATRTTSRPIPIERYWTLSPSD